MRPIIKVNNISKYFYINAKHQDNLLKESLTKLIRAPFKSILGNSSQKIWPLKGVSFEVMPGEVVAIVGPNGSGKSTLLKILSRVLEPTSGSAEIYGRMSSLLEVGTGFHPDLTGRENIYLNGAMLGMTKAEIKQQFDAIVSFAEIDQFLDTPIKHYSSGMHIRLAFSVAVHLQTDILILDEVLSVGDANFQLKFEGKIKEIIHSGRTILLVSHSETLVRQFCHRGILLIDGQIKKSDTLEAIFKDYSDFYLSDKPA